MFYLDGAFYLKDPDADEDHFQQIDTQEDKSLENSRVAISRNVVESCRNSTLCNTKQAVSDDDNQKVKNDGADNRKYGKMKQDRKLQIKDVLQEDEVHISAETSDAWNNVHSYNEVDKTFESRDDSEKNNIEYTIKENELVFSSTKTSDRGDDFANGTDSTLFGIPAHYWYQVSSIFNNESLI